MHKEIKPAPFGRILIVDDTTANLQLLTNLLTEHGYRVHPASDGELALEFVQSILPDLVLLDIRMPGMDGYEVCRRLKDDERTRSIPIIFISILEDERDKVKGFQEGAVDYITKPFQAEEVLARVRTHLRLRELTELLEKKVVARTKELMSAQEQLQEELFERKKVEKALRESEKKYRLIVDTANEGIMVLGPDAKIVFANARMSEILGYPAEEIIKRLFTDFMFEEDISDHLQKMVTRRKGISENYERRFRRKDGEEVWTFVSATPIFGDENYFNGSFGMFTDITERKHAEEALRESERQKELILNSTAEMVTYYDTDLRVIWANRASGNALGRSPEEMVGRHCYEMCHQSGKPCTGCPLLKARDDKMPRQREMEDPKGRYRLVRGFPIIDENDQVTALVGFVQDITERKQAEKEREKLQEQFLQAQKMELVGRLAGGVAHDFNNMLSVVIGYTEVALQKQSLDDTLRGYLQEILEAGSRSAAITRQLLAFARKQTISPMVLDLNQTVESMLKMLRRLIGEDISLTWMPGAELWKVKMDPSQIDQILANLCINARDAITGVGKISIQTQNVTSEEEYCADHVDALPGEYVQLAVSDDGCGMDKETLNRLFEPFFTTKDVGKGTGLGLATVYGIVRQNNGFINVYSEPGYGAIFRIYLPSHAASIEEIRRESAVVPTARGQETILVVEDDAAVLDLVKIMLESLGYRVIFAATPDEAIHIAKENSSEIHLLLTDVIMPKMTGRDLAKELSLLYPTLKQLFMSGYTGNIIAHQGVLDEDVNFIQKPFSRQVLAGKVREVLDQE